jgi:hypothetical protein
MPRETTHAGILGQWQRLLAPLEANAGELTHLEGSRTKLAALLTRAQAINRDQAAQTAAKQEASRQIRTVLPDGERLATLLRQAVREHYGPRSEKLAEFGLQPFRGRRRPATAPDEPEAPPPVTPEAAEDAQS